MNNKILVVVLIALLALGGLYFYKKKPVEKTTTQNAVSTSTPTSTGKIKAFDPKNFAIEIEGQTFTLADGKAEIASAPGSASKDLVLYFGNDAWGDVNGDGYQDLAFLITKQGSGSGTFYYAVVALGGQSAYIVTNPILLGDRIAPQSTEIDSIKSELRVNYAERKAGEPLTASPSVGVTGYFKVTGENLVRVK